MDQKRHFLHQEGFEHYGEESSCNYHKCCRGQQVDLNSKNNAVQSFVGDTCILQSRSTGPQKAFLHRPGHVLYQGFLYYSGQANNSNSAINK